MLECRGRRIFLGILLIVTMVISGMQTVAYANPENDGEVVEIGTVEDLKTFASEVNSGNDDYKGKTVKLTADIDLSEAGDWTPIGTQSKPFRGTFDGKGHTVSGMRASASDSMTSVGFFGCVHNGTVKNIKLIGAKIDGEIEGNKNTSYYIGGLVAANKAGSSTANKVTVENCSVEVDFNLTVSGEAKLYAGGIIGWTDTNRSVSAAKISGTTCDVDVNYESGALNYSAYIGGFFGSAGNINGSFEVTDCSGNLEVEVVSENTPKELSIGGVFGCSNIGVSNELDEAKYLKITKTDVNTKLDFSNADSVLNSKSSYFCKTDIGGFIGTGVHTRQSKIHPR